MTQHEHLQDVRVVPKYDMDTLGAPFKITVHDGVTVGKDPHTGKEVVQITDHAGLIGAIVRTRALNRRKLSGEEIKFFRKALCVRAKMLAEFLDMSPEHFSRCEAGTKTMSTASEKHLRMFAFVATFHPDAEELLAKLIRAEPKDEEEIKSSKYADYLINRFMGMKIQVVFDPSDELHFEFVRRARRVEAEEPTSESTDEGEWKGELVLTTVPAAA